jgi:hypothetical protein
MNIVEYEQSYKRHVLALYEIKYLTISQHDESYIILDKMNHLSVSHYVKDDIPQCNSLHQDVSPKTLPSLQ